MHKDVNYKEKLMAGKTEKNTHFDFDNKEIVISSNLRPIFDFLSTIEQEINFLLNQEKRFQSIEKQYSEMVEVAGYLAKKLKENSIETDFNFSESRDAMIKKLSYIRPIRVEMVALFAYLETLFCLYLAYKHKTSDQIGIIKLATNSKNIGFFLNKFCLNTDNNWMKDNSERAKHLKAKNIRILRNSLTHFFSVDKKIQIGDVKVNEESRKIEKMLNNEVSFLSPEDLYGIIKGAISLIMMEWTSDCKKFSNTNSNEFNEKFLCVQKIVDDCGANLVIMK